MRRFLFSPLLNDSALDRRTIPKIAGSEIAFLLLVVCLSLIVMFSCGAVFCLLRNNRSSEQGRANRSRNRRRQRPPVSTTMPYNYTPSVGSPQSANRSRWSLFGRRSTDQSQSQTHTKPGWFKAGSSDWDMEYEGDGTKSPDMEEALPHVRSPPIAKFTAATTTTTSPFESSSADIQYSPIYSRSVPQTFPIPVRSSSPEPIPGSGSVEGTETLYHTGKEERKDTGQSRLSLWTFEGGTKFIESL